MAAPLTPCPPHPSHQQHTHKCTHACTPRLDQAPRCSLTHTVQWSIEVPEVLPLCETQIWVPLPPLTPVCCVILRWPFDLSGPWLFPLLCNEGATRKRGGSGME